MEPQQKKKIAKKKDADKKREEKKKQITSTKRKHVEEDKEEVHQQELQEIRVQGDEIVERVEDVLPKLQCRVSPKTLYSATKKMNPEQMDVVRRIGFGKILDMEFNEIPLRLAYFLVQKFSHTTSSIELTIGNIQITRESIHEMFGVPIGGKDIQTGQRSKKGENITKMWRNQYKSGVVRSKEVMERIINSGDTGILFVLNFLVLFTSTMIEGNQLGSVNTKFLPYITNEEEVTKLDWSGYILNCLKVAVRSWKDESTGVFFVGPLSTLVVSKKIIS